MEKLNVSDIDADLLSARGVAIHCYLEPQIGLTRQGEACHSWPLKELGMPSWLGRETVGRRDRQYIACLRSYVLDISPRDKTNYSEA